MIAYNNTDLHNDWIQEEANNAFDDQCITATEQTTIKNAYPVHFYTPNFFIRIGLFVLTNIVLSFSMGLFSLIFLSSNENAWKGLILFFSLMVYGALELMVQTKKHYQSGVDDALLWHFAILFFAGLFLIIDAQPLTAAVLAFVIALFCTIRFADRLMAVIVLVSFLAILFYLFTERLSFSLAFLPFILMAAAAGCYWLITKLNQKTSFIYYRHCFTWLQIASLVCFYAAGNYFVVREANQQLLHLTSDGHLPFSWIFWCFTVAIPLIYIARGIQQKDALFLRIGLLLIAAMIFTIRYYHSVMPLEIAMTVAGICLLLIAYALIQYLYEPKYGFTKAERNQHNKADKLNLEALVIAETLGQTNTPTDNAKFGGGSFGGGGAGGEF